MRLFSYCLRYDVGAAPNPYWGLCTLTICKPAIRRAAQVGDWVVGLGSANLPENRSNQVVFTMKVTYKKTMAEYDQFCQAHLPGKIPQWQSRDYARRVGDCIYDYSKGEPPRMRKGVHDEGNRARDLGGQYALLSDHFYYFGNQPVGLPDHLKPIIHSTQGHKSNANQPYAKAFVSWIERLGYEPNEPHGEPQLKLELRDDPEMENKCAICYLKEDDEDICQPC